MAIAEVAPRLLPPCLRSAKLPKAGRRPPRPARRAAPARPAPPNPSPLPCRVPPRPNQMFRDFVDHVVDCAFTGAAPAAPADAARAGPLPLRLPAPERLVAIGDLHGDFEKARRAFRLAGLTDDAGNWAGGSTVCVQVRGERAVRPAAVSRRRRALRPTAAAFALRTPSDRALSSSTTERPPRHKPKHPSPPAMPPLPPLNRRWVTSWTAGTMSCASSTSSSAFRSRPRRPVARCTCSTATTVRCGAVRRGALPGATSKSRAGVPQL
jgi:hypothetical protein